MVISCSQSIFNSHPKLLHLLRIEVVLNVSLLLGPVIVVEEAIPELPLHAGRPPPLAEAVSARVAVKLTRASIGS